MKEATQYHQKKGQAWSAIAADFNMSARISHDSDTLKRKYEKKRSKARYADEKLKT
jgi:hypothetical protein